MDASKYNSAQRANLTALITAARSKGITNINSLTGISTVVGKETNFIYKFESGYKTTSNARIRAIFGDRLKGYSESQLTALKANDYNFFEAVYGYKTAIGRKYGNTMPGDGYKFRGGGPNQLTFKANYERVGKQIGIDLVKNPELVNRPDVAAAVAVQYFINAFNSAPKATLLKYNSTGINDFKNQRDSVNAFYHANAGFGKSTAAIEADKTGGLQKVRNAADSFLNFLSDNKTVVTTIGSGTLLLIGVGLFFLFKD